MIQGKTSITLESIANTKETDLINEVFSVVPANPAKFEEYMNMNNFWKKSEEIKDTLNLNDINIVTGFYLLEKGKRHKIIKSISMRLEKDRSFPPDYFAITLVQSFCVMFTNPLSSFSKDELIDFLNAFKLGWSCLPLHYELCARVYIIFYAKTFKLFQKLIQEKKETSETIDDNEINIKSENEYGNLLDFINEINQVALEFAHFFMPFTVALIEATNILLKIVDFSNLNIIEPYLIQHFKFILKGIKWDVAESCKHSQLMLTEIAVFLPMIKTDKLVFIFQILTFFIHFIQPDSSYFSLISLMIDNFIKTSKVFPLIEENKLPKFKVNSSINKLCFRLINEEVSNLSSENSRRSSYVDDDNHNKTENLDDGPSLLTLDKTIKLKNYELHESTKDFILLFGKDSLIVEFAQFFGTISKQQTEKVFEFLFQICKPRIEAGDLNFQAMLMIFMINEDHMIEFMIDYCCSNQVFSVLMNNFLMNPSYSLFHDFMFEYEIIENHKFLIMRQTLIEILAKLLNLKQSVDLLSSAIVSLKPHVNNCLVITEIFLYFTKKIIRVNNKINDKVPFQKDNVIFLLEILSREILIQQNAHIKGDKYAPRYRTILLLLIGEMSHNKIINQYMFLSKNFLVSFFSLVFEPNIFDMFLSIFNEVSSYLIYNIGKLFNNFRHIIHEIFDNILKKINEPLMSQVFFNFTLLLQALIVDQSNEFVPLFVKSTLFDEFNKIISVIDFKDSGNEEEGAILFIQIYEMFSKASVNNDNVISFSALIKPLQRIQMTENVLNSLKLLVSYPNPSFTSIENPALLPVLVFSVQNNHDYFFNVIEELCSICRDSVWNCFSVFKSDILLKLLEIINDSMEQDIVEKILQLFCIVNISVSSRQLLYAFARLFRIYDEKQTHIPKYLDSYMNCFRTVFTVKKHTPPSFLHFASSMEYIEMKSPTTKELNNGFTISLWLLLDKFVSHVDSDITKAFSLILFKGNNSKLLIYLLNKSICLKFMKDNEPIFIKSVEIAFPKLEWFNLVLQYNKDVGLIPFVNGFKKDKINMPLTFLFEDFNSIFFHFEPDKEFDWITHGQISSIAMFLGNTPDNIGEIIFKSGIEGEFSILSLPNIFCMFSSFKAHEGILINYLEGSSITKAKFKGLICNFVASFSQVFESSNGTAFITGLWSLMKLTYSDGKEERRIISWFTQIMETVLKNSKSSQARFLKSKTCEIIAYFIRSLPPNRISTDVWGCFNRLFNTATNIKLKISICENILFNINILKMATTNVVIGILEQWCSFIKTVRPEFWSQCVSIPIMIDLFKYYQISSLNENIPEISAITQVIGLCMSDIALTNFSMEDAETLLNFIIQMQSSTDTLNLLKVFENVFYNNKYLNSYDYYILLLSYVPHVFAENNLNSKSILDEFILLFNLIRKKLKSPSIMTQFIFGAIQYKTQQQKEEVANSLMEYFLAESIGLKAHELRDGNVSNFIIQNPSSLVSAFFSAYFISDSSMNYFNSIIGKISVFPENQTVISERISNYSLLVISFYTIVVNKSIIPFVAALIYKNIEILKNIFKFIDVFEQCTSKDYNEILSSFVESIIPLLISNSSLSNKGDYFELFIEQLLFHKKKGPFSWSQKPKSPEYKLFSDYLSLFKTELKLSPYKITFGCLIHNNKWINHKLAKSILQFLSFLLKDKSIKINPKSVAALIYVLTNHRLDYSTILPQISQIIKLMKQDFIIEPLLHNISKTKNQPKEFLKTHFNETSIQPTIQIYNQTNEILSDFIQQSLHKIESNQNDCTVNSKTNTTTNLSIMNNYSHNLSILELMKNFFVEFSSIKFKKMLRNRSQLNKSLMILRKPNTDQHWRRLTQNLKNERSPFIPSSLLETHIHYKRTSYYDHRFRPILLLPNNNFDNHYSTSSSNNDNTLQFLDSTNHENSNENQHNSSLGKIGSKDSLASFDTLDESTFNDEDALWISPCYKTKIRSKINGTFYVFNNCYRFIDENQKTINFKAEGVLFIFWRWNLHIANSIEIFMDNHKSYFLTFSGQTDHSFMNKLTKISLPNKIYVQTKPSNIEVQNLHLAEKWVNHSMSTFDYLMILNLFSGRSFLNVSCYPIFPWVLVDYSSPTINLHRSIYRDFEIPVGALNKQALEKNKERILAEAEASEGRSSFLYQTGYSNPFIITYYLLRLEPFTTLHISLMDGKFDNPNRLFHSIHDAFMLLITSNQTFRELIPEFFFLPEFLVNSDKFNFGKTLKDITINDAVIPPWSSSPVDFINKHILALESEECGKELSNWIDLIWGYKQNGKQAIDADNTFDPHMYSMKFDEDDIRTNEIREWIGQIPIQLFTSEHPKRLPVNSIPKNNPNIPDSAISSINNCFNSTHNSNANSTNSNNCFVKVTSINIEGDTLDKLKIYTVHKDGKIMCTKANGMLSKLLIKEAQIPSDHRLITTFDESTFMCSLNDGNGLLIYHTSMKKPLISEEKPHIAAISCVAITKGFVITGGCDACVVLWKWSHNVISVASQSVVNFDTISSVAVSSEYGIAISCSASGNMTIFRIPHLDFIRSIDLGIKKDTAVANNVMITKGIGNIIVICENESSYGTILKTYSINGIPLESTKLNYHVTHAITFTDKRMIDYIMLLIDNKELIFAESNNIHAFKTIYKNEKKISMFAYHEKAKLIVIAKESGGILLIPFSL
ncbi:hypothetical protein TRFO_33166 [Tritrichomonas foetus]|uniref:BEACH domain-containing protein n=1 Tax=Tritrichomonas foetus TaxID=1144522 RepID=A0A1J4JRQ4_9EUKA|nr:hypothetical protein TRFO_33166 [Tritrichomonas foetus]|eukprot:OHT00214.1 hypothetical protein TRFO_33166 [Tritrichomonas foetus]